MPDIKIVTEVAGRVCAIPAQAGTTIASGDDIALIEAMKMEIPVTSNASGEISSILVNIDDVVAEGQTIAIVKT
jgi:biotin carboxyl carrier protein